MLQILLLEDSPLDADLVDRYLDKDGIAHALRRVETREAFQEALGAGNPWDLILADYALPQFDGMSALMIARTLRPEVPFIFVSGALGEERAVESLRQGATDYVMKTRLQRLPSVVNRAIAETEVRNAQRRSEERQRLLVAELNHRVKNTLATVMSLVTQTISSSRTMQDFDAAFSGRLRALADAHSLLSSSDWDVTDLGELVELVIRPQRDGDNFRVDGPKVMLWPQAALTMSLILHELASNAARHGALVDPKGMVALRWRIIADGAAPELWLDWTEQGGPAVEVPAERGFGLRFVERSASYELDGMFEIAFPRDGAVCRLRFPLKKEISSLAPR